MNSRLADLIAKGYPEDEVLRLANFTNEELEYASMQAFKHISRNCTPVEKPQAIFIGGQPGCGKTVMSMNYKNKNKNAVEIGIDNYRMYHPNYLEIEKTVREHWKNRREELNDSPGNDIANFTHLFAGAMTDKLIEMGCSNKYNLILEWGMREPTAPLNVIKNLKDKGYINTVIFVAVYKEVSYKACNLRANVMKNTNHIIRKVPKEFHDLCIKTLPSSINEIYKKGYLNNIVDHLSIINRKGNVLWNNNSNVLPGVLYNYCLNNNVLDNETNDLELAMLNNYKEMIGLNMHKDDLIEIYGLSPYLYEDVSKRNIK